ncbi:sulfur-oxidizing protein SoxY [Paucibacter oligotrophus]|uniref:Sulfur-oxidizing protein SoxY n=1 Tax=Roseateles oligotrophus TaxID=1769250 RepID=A0A840LDJ3_9BURK|nr:quinoprotein dehydrogenase-associated SoxYZ-like carrier [Roseateles oligotrophus]MBB4845771.1 sulfur-oxidizing protein SoxY [Roseateles oligotrophus]
MNPQRRNTCLQLACLLACPRLSLAQAPPDPNQSPRWLQLRASLFADQEPQRSELVLLRVPARAVDAGAVPLDLQAPALAPGTASPLAKLYLVIDENPTPLAAVFEFGGPALPAVQTQVRIDGYTHVRGVAEYADGSRLMSLQFVKAVGGCSAPPLGGSEAGRLGEMSWQLAPPPQAGQPQQARWQIRHPNHNGMQMDPLTRLTPAAHFLRHVKLSWGEQLLFAADLDFAISEPPGFGLQLRPGPAQTLRAEADDSQGREFRASFPP